MSKRLMIATFEREEDTLAAVRASRQRGLKILDVLSPYAVHGLDHALGLRRSRLPWIVFGVGLTGAVLKVVFQVWTSSVNWPINVGGKPFRPWLAFVPVTFEVMVLFAGITGLLVFLIACRLYPGRRAVLPVARTTDDRFAIVVEQTDAAFDARAVSTLMRGCRAVQIEEHVEGER
jgi:hypothetical protein